MAKKETSPEAPVVTTLPLPNSENAMVIDLPDGQKLVVGKMATGTVIEVATWRGTGRPDSRTTRLMLGVSSQESVDAHAAKSQGTEAAAKPAAMDYVKAFAAKALVIISDVTAKAKKFKVEKPSTSPTLAAPESAPVAVVSSDTDTDVQAWLDSIIAKSEKKEAARATIKAAEKKAPVKKATTKKAAATRRAR
jgi:hypothetical protein